MVSCFLPWSDESERTVLALDRITQVSIYFLHSPQRLLKRVLKYLQVIRGISGLSKSGLPLVLWSGGENVFQVKLMALLQEQLIRGSW